MNNTTKVGVAVAAGYLLGRRRKAKLALAVASMLTGKRLRVDLRQLAREAATQVTSSPEVKKLTAEIKGELLQAGRGAVTATVTDRLDRVAESLHERTEAMRSAVEQALPQAGKRDTGPGEQPAEGGGTEGGGQQGTEGTERAGGGPEAAPRPRARRQAPPESGGQRPRRAPVGARPVPRRRPAQGEAAERPRRAAAQPGQARRRHEG